VRAVRVRSKRLDEVDEAKLALALWLIAKRLADAAATRNQTAPDDAVPKRSEAA